MMQVGGVMSDDDNQSASTKGAKQLVEWYDVMRYDVMCLTCMERACTEALSSSCNTVLTIR